MAKAQNSSKTNSSTSRRVSGDKSVSKRKASGATTSSGCFHVQCTYNNTIITATNQNGRTVNWRSGGTTGYKNTKKSTSEAAEQAARSLSETVKNMGMSFVSIKFKGYGPGREGVIRGIISAGLNVTSLSDVTPTAHNGPRKKKAKRN